MRPHARSVRSPVLTLRWSATMPSVDDSRAQAIDAAVGAGDRGDLPADELRVLLTRYVRDVADEDLAAWSPDGLAACVLRHRELASRRPDGTANVRLHTPPVEEHGRGGGHTVVEIVNDDMPFLVDSVTAELSRQHRGIHLVIHPTLLVRRDEGATSWRCSTCRRPRPARTTDAPWPPTPAWSHGSASRSTGSRTRPRSRRSRRPCTACSTTSAPPWRTGPRCARRR
ncbi:hypothetical protein [Cellulomonas sp. ATA003]|uniref:hypothetical protein n=1 Tax=Cellulomonas sp. ATA003 TaxID=3073064 RepID=UPI0037BF6DC3